MAVRQRMVVRSATGLTEAVRSFGARRWNKHGAETSACFLQLKRADVSPVPIYCNLFPIARVLMTPALIVGIGPEAGRQPWRLFAVRGNSWPCLSDEAEDQSLV